MIKYKNYLTIKNYQQIKWNIFFKNDKIVQKNSNKLIKLQKSLFSSQQKPINNNTHVYSEQIPINTAPKQLPKKEEIYNPIIFNVKQEYYVIKGKEKQVGLWLASVSAAIFGMVVLGGYTRLTKSGLSMVRWEPHRILPPMNQFEWQQEFLEY